MESHFSKVLGNHSAIEKPHVTFIAADTFQGRKHGFKFLKGSKGIGYYYDRVQAIQSVNTDTVIELSCENDAMDNKKRKRDDEDEILPSASKPSIEEMLEEAEATGMVQLDPFSLKQLLLSIEKKITKNQKMRMKFAEEPTKFMDSEVELHTEIQELYAVAASPELYPVLVQAGAVPSLLGCLAHENTDISIAVIGLLQEMTEVDTISDELQDAIVFIDAFKESQGFELVVQNLSRLDESIEEDAQGVQQSLAIIENLVEIDSSNAVYACEKTNVLVYLLERCRSKAFDANKLYSSEILSILLQSDERVPLLLSTLRELDGMEALLQCIALYRKKEVTATDEQECVENLFLSLCATLQLRSNQQKFLECEGFELMLRCLKEQQYVAGCAIPALNYAVLRNKACCAQLVDVGGMKYVFPLLTGGGMKKALKRKGSGEKRHLEDSALSIVAQLCCWLGQGEGVEKESYPVRILNKLAEREQEKLERCVELYGKYSRMLEATDEEIERTREALAHAGDQEALEDFEDEDNIYSQRLEGGLFNLQQVSMIIAYSCVFDPVCRKKAELSLATESATLEDVLMTLRDLLLTLREGHDDVQDEAEAKLEGSSERDMDVQYKKVLVQWTAALAEIINSSNGQNGE